MIAPSTYQIIDLVGTTPYYTRSIAEAVERAGGQVRMDMRVAREFVREGESGQGHQKARLRSNKPGLARAEYISDLARVVARAAMPKSERVLIQWETPGLRFLLNAAAGRRRAQRRSIIALTAHNVLPHDHNLDRRARTDRRQALLSYDIIFVHTNEELAKLQDLLEPARRLPSLHLLEQGPVPLRLLTVSSQQARQSLGLPPDGTLFVYCGVIRPYKGVDVLVEAWKRTAPKGSHLLVAGNPIGNYDYEIDLASASMRGDMTVVSRKLSDSELSLVHHAADVLVYPYRDVTESAAVLTGAHCNSAIIASDHPPIRRSLKERPAVTLVRPGSVDDLAAAIVRHEGVSSPSSLEGWTLHANWDAAGFEIVRAFNEAGGGGA